MRTLSSAILCFTLFAILSSSEVFCQRRISKADIGLNIASLYSGLPELKAAAFINRYIGVIGATGYAFHPRRSFFKLDDGAEVTKSRGSYWKLGIRGRYFFAKEIAPVPWIEVMYVGAQYDETGTREILSGPAEAKHVSGTVHGFAAALGWDFAMGNRLDLRIGLQGGYCKRDEHIGAPVMTFQPGLGANFGEDLRLQMILAVNYKIGRIERK
jgi:hypothetical protein